MAAVLHSSAFKQSHVNSHNAALKKMADKWAKFGSTMPYTELTLADFLAKPGYYIKHRSEWMGPFDTANAATESKAEWDFEAKHG